MSYLKIPVLILLVLHLVAGERSLSAAEFDSVEMEDGFHFIFVQGAIEAGDADKFRQIAAQFYDAAVLLESPGGSTIDAIEIGETIRIKGFSTLVLNGSQCSSACALIWMAGSPRTLTKSARVGLHATYIDRNGQKLESGVGNALVGRYLTLLNLPMKAVIFATQSPPDQLNWLDASNASTAGIEVQLIDDLDSSEEGVSQSQSVPAPPSIRTRPIDRQVQDTEYFSQASDWLIIVDNTLAGSCFAIKYFNDGTILRLNNDARHTMNPKNMGAIVFLTNPAWASLEIGQEFNLIFTLTNFEPWEAPALVVDMGDTLMLRTFFDGTTAQTFKSELGAAASLHIQRGGRTVAWLPLDDSGDALAELSRCQNTANRKRRDADPFAN